ncbi:MAG: hypothetical protein K6U78_16025 [Anaerolineae bacterium]|nr:hypothetical protein [Anaerolineae bacterium]
MIPASNLLSIAAGIVAVGALLILVNAILTARWAQRAAYYGVRREAQRTANRRLALSVSAFVLAGALLVMSWSMPRQAAQPPPPDATGAEAGVAVASPTLPTPSSDVAPTAIPTPGSATPTPQVTASPAATAIVQPAPAAQPAPTLKATPIPEPTSSLISPLPTLEPTTLPAPAGAAQVPPNKRLVLNAIASGVDANGAPMGMSTTFDRGVETIYVFFDFQDVPPSALLRHSWFRDGGSVFFRSKRLAQNGRGTDYVSWSPPGGFQPGLYEVRISLGGVLQFVANFEVR